MDLGELFSFDVRYGAERNERIPGLEGAGAEGGRAGVLLPGVNNSSKR